MVSLFFCTGIIGAYLYLPLAFTMSNSLLHCRKPFHEESLMGYITDLAEKNGYDETVWLLEKAGVKHRNLYLGCSFLFDDKEWVKNLSALTRNDSSAINQIIYSKVGNGAMSYRSNQKIAAFNGRSIYKFLLRPERPRICPRCLDEEGYCRRIWEFLLVTTCPRHQCLLIDTCPACQQKICWPHRWINVCRYSSNRWGKECGFDWAQAPVQLVGEEETRLSSELSFLSGFDLGTKVKITAPFHRLNLLDFSAVILFFASQSDQKITYGGATGRSFNALSLATHHKLFTRARSIFDDWPAGFHVFLAGLGLPQPIETIKMPLTQNRVIRNIQTALFHRHLSGPQFESFRNEFANYRISQN